MDDIGAGQHPATRHIPTGNGRKNRKNGHLRLLYFCSDVLDGGFFAHHYLLLWSHVVPRFAERRPTDDVAQSGAATREPDHADHVFWRIDVGHPEHGKRMLAPTTVLGENLLRPLYTNLRDEQLLKIMRYSVVAIAVVTGGMALMRDNIYELVGESSALSLVSLFTPLIGGLYWKRASSVGSIASMILGMAFWLLTLWIDTEIPCMLYGFGASIMGMLFGSWFYPDKEPHILHQQELLA
jgi:hypothetical protein